MYRYTSNNPILFSDPFGLLTFEQNLQRRRCINKGVINKGVKTAASVALGSPFLKSVSKTGFSTGLYQLLKTGFKVPGLSPGFGSIGNFLGAAAMKAVAFGAAFAGGADLGNRIGAYVDTAVDNNKSVLGIKSETLDNLGFGSGGSQCNSECQ